MIPARIGSVRLKYKNLAFVNSKPLIYYSIQAAKDSGVFDNIVVNSEHNIFSKIASRYGVEFYNRPKDLGTSSTKSDEVVANFMRSYSSASVVAWVNPIAPFQTGEEISEIIKYFFRENLDSLITVENKQVHCLSNGKPLNYKKDAVFTQTQELIPVQAFVYSVMMWRSQSFLDEYAKKGYAIFCGKFGTFPVSPMTSMIIKTENDLRRVDSIMQCMNKHWNEFTIEYDPLVKIIISNSEKNQ
jgi:CMP-N-acetylneuraminic acid synthetase